MSGWSSELRVLHIECQNASPPGGPASVPPAFHPAPSFLPPGSLPGGDLAAMCAYPSLTSHFYLRAPASGRGVCTLEAHLALQSMAPRRKQAGLLQPTGDCWNRSFQGPRYQNVWSRRGCLGSGGHGLLCDHTSLSRGEKPG